MERTGTGLMRLGAGCLLIGMSVSVGCQADRVETEAVISRLDAPDPAVRTEAISYWLDGDNSTPSRIARRRELWSAIDEQSGDFQPDTLRELYRHLTHQPNMPAYEVSALMPLTYQRMLQTALADAATDEQERQRIMYMIVPSKDGGVNRNGRYGLLWDVAGDAERTAIWETHGAVFEALAGDAEAEHCEPYFHNAYIVMGADASALLDMLLDAKSQEIRRRARLLHAMMGFPCDRKQGWQSEPDAVAMCMVAADILGAEDPAERIARLRADPSGPPAMVSWLETMEQLPRTEEGRIKIRPTRLPEPHDKELWTLLLQVDYVARMASHRREYLLEVSAPVKIGGWSDQGWGRE